MITEGMELTRGTKKIIQEAIETVDIEQRNDRLALCEEFCRIVENRYTGGAMSYQLKRMGNTYPLDLLSKNGWTIQDALENGLVVYLSSGWFFDDRLKEHNGQIYKESQVTIQPTDIQNKQLEGLPLVTPHHLEELNISVVENITGDDSTQLQEISVWAPITEEEEFHLNEKMYWLGDLPISQDADGNDIFMTSEEVWNFSQAQSKSRGMLTSRTNSVKIPLETTGPILEAIDKYLYDKTGQYVL